MELACGDVVVVVLEEVVGLVGLVVVVFVLGGVAMVWTPRSESQEETELM